MLNRFRRFQAKKPTVPALNGQCQDGWNTNQNQMKKKITRYLLKVHLIKSCKTIGQIFYFILFYISFYISRHHFLQILRTSFNNYLKKKIFVTTFSLWYKPQFIFFLLFFTSSSISRYYFPQLFTTSFKIVWKKIFVTNFLFFIGFTQTCPPT